MANESLILGSPGGLALNDGTAYTIDGETFVFRPAEKKPLWATNASANGDALVSEAHYGPSFFEFDVHAVPAATPAAGLEALGKLLDAFQGCERIEGGEELLWTPAGTVTAYTAYVLLAEINDVPITVSGADAGWFLNAPLLKVKLTCRPFLYALERVVLAATESGAEPLQVAYVEGIKGDVPAEGRLVLTDKATQDRRFAEWGQDVVESKVNPPLLLEAGPDLGLPGLLDSFNRANEDPVGQGGNWVGKVFSSNENMKVVNNQLARSGAGGIGSAVYNRTMADGEVSVTIATLGNSYNLWIRTANEGTAKPTGYLCTFSNPESVQLQKFDGEVFSSLAASVTQVIAPGDAIALRAIGTTLRVRHKPAGGSWKTLIEATDVTYSSGRIAIRGSESTLRYDDFKVVDLSTKTGSYSTNVVKATLTPTAVALCSTGSIKHIGSYRLKLRCQADGEGALFRASYRVGDGPWTSLPWVAPPLENEWCELDLREAFLEEAEKGEQVSEIRIEGKVESKAKNVIGYVDFLNPMPTLRYGVGRGPTHIDSPTLLDASDPFDDVKGALTGQSADIGGTWEAAGGIADFEEVKESEEAFLKRAAKEDVKDAGRYVFLSGTAGMTDTVVECEVKRTGITETNNLHQGVLARYVNNENWLRLNFVPATLIHSNLILRWKVAGVLFENIYALPSHFSEGSWGKLRLVVMVDGTATVYWQGAKIATKWRSEFAQGGALAKGKVGIYDGFTAVDAVTRNYRNFVAWTPAVPTVCESSQSLECRHDAVERENAGGTYWSPVPEYRGAHFLLDPAGGEKRINRLAVKMRRNDNKLESDSTVTDKHTLEVLARERYLTPH